MGIDVEKADPVKTAEAGSQKGHGETRVSETGNQLADRLVREADEILKNPRSDGAKTAEMVLDSFLEGYKGQEQNLIPAFVAIHNSGRTAQEKLILQHQAVIDPKGITFLPSGIGEVTPNGVAEVSKELRLAQSALRQPAVACEAEVSMLGNPQLHPGINMLKLRNGLSVPSNHEDGGPWTKGDNTDQFALQPEQAPRDTTAGAVRPEPSYLPQLQKVFGGSYFDEGRDHNAILDTDLNTIMKKQGLPKDAPFVMINVDTHSDVYADPGMSRESIADWGNKIINKYPNLTDYYWIMPNEVQHLPHFENKGPDKFNSIMSDSPPDVSVYVNKQTGSIIRWGGEPPQGEDYRTVTFHKRTLDQMDDLKGKTVALTTDLDHFANVGFDTADEAKVPWKGDEGFKHYLDVLDSKHIHPFFHYITFSPEYTQHQAVPDLLRFAAYSADVSLTHSADHLSFHHDKVYATTPQDGIPVTVDTNKGTQLMDALFRDDAKTTNPNGLFDTTQPSAKLDSALAAVKSIYGVDGLLAMDILRNFGDQHGIVNYRVMLKSLQDVCRTSYQ